MTAIDEYLNALDQYLERHTDLFLIEDATPDSRPLPMGGYLNSENENSIKTKLSIFLEKTKVKKFFYALAELKDKKKSQNLEPSSERNEYVKLYKNSFVSKAVFCNMYNGKIPEKDTVIKFAFGLDANLQDAEMLLKYAGYALGDCIKRDLIFKFCFEQKITDTLTVNELLEHCKEKPLLKNSKNQTQTTKNFKPLIVKMMQ
ncbi:hypothetical protein AGMMS49938_13350 [Fibrobacterales bacterium]|nr:hypothetical protein AGMMS49938_13350 [Fibrobacterales bacterium]